MIAETTLDRLDWPRSHVVAPQRKVLAPAAVERAAGAGPPMVVERVEHREVDGGDVASSDLCHVLVRDRHSCAGLSRLMDATEGTAASTFCQLFVGAPRTYSCSIRPSPVEGEQEPKLVLLLFVDASSAWAVPFTIATSPPAHM